MDNFDQYGGDLSQLHDPFDIITNNTSTLGYFISTDFGRNGASSLARGRAQTNQLARLPLSRTVTTCGVAFAFYSLNFPQWYGFLFFEYSDSNEGANISIMLEPTGRLAVIRGHVITEGTVLGRTDFPVIRNRSWQHIEIKTVFDGASGSVEIRVDEETVLNLTGINTVASVLEKNSSSGEIAGVADCAYLSIRGGVNANETMPDAVEFQNVFYYDSLIVWDDTGSYNNDFLGDHFVENVLVTGDTAQADWTALAGNPYANIDELLGNDAEASFIYTPTPGSPSIVSSNFTTGSLSSTSGTVAAVGVLTKARKDTDETTELRNGVVSGGSASVGSSYEVDGIYRYYATFFDVDPASGVAFTPTEVNNLQLQISRVT
jgi:hypothetical protein